MKGKHEGTEAMIFTHCCYPLVYVAGPVASDPVEGARRALTVAGRMVKEERAVPVVPHLFLLPKIMGSKGFPTDPEEWLHLDAELIKRCDALYRLSGDSPGSDREVVFAQDIELPIFEEETATLMGDNAPVRTDVDNGYAWTSFCRWADEWAEDAGCAG